MNIARLGLAAALAVALGGPAKAQIATLQIQVVDGEGAVHAPGAHAMRSLSVAVQDETGKLVEGAAVSFHLPEDGPSGTFDNGLRTTVVTSDARGRATVRGLILNRVPGRFQIRIVAAKEQSRAGIVSFQYIAEPAGGQAAPAASSASRHRGRWIAVAAIVAGGAAAGILAGRSGGASASAPPVSIPASTQPAAPSLSIGSPTITVTHP